MVMRFSKSILHNKVREKSVIGFKQFLRIVLFLFIVLFIPKVVWGQTTGDYRAVAGTNWSTLATWERYTGAAWATPTAGQGYPGQFSSPALVTIQNGYIVTLDVSPANSIGALTINNGNTNSGVTFSGTNSLSVTNATTISANSNNINKYIYIDAGSYTTGTLSLNATNGDTRDAFVRISTGTCTIGGDITMNNTNLRTYILFTGTGTLYAGGTITGGGITSNAGGGATAPTSGTVNYNHFGAQSIGIYTYYNLTTSNSGIKTLTGAITVNNNLAITGTATLASDAYQITGNATGTFTMASGTTLTLGNTGSATSIIFPTNFTSGNTTLNSASTVIYQSTAAQVVSNIPSYGNLTLATSGTKTLAGATTVNGNLAIQGSATLASDAYQITGNATGTFTMASGATLTLGNTGSATNILFPTNFTSANTILNSASRVIYQSNGAQTVSNVPAYGNLQVSTGNTKTVTGSVTVNGDLTVDNGVTLSMGTATATWDVVGNATVDGTLDFSTTAAKTFNLTGNLVNVTGTITMTGAGLVHNLNLGGSNNAISTFTTTAGSGSTVTYNRAGDQQVFGSGNYQNLTLSGSGIKTMQGAVTVNNNLAIQGTATFATGTNTLTGNATGNLTLAANTGLNLGLTTSGTSIGFPANFTTAHTTLDVASTVTYQSNAAQNISAVPASYGNLVLSTGAAASTKTALGLLLVNGGLTINTNATLDLSTYAGSSSVAGNASVNGTILFGGTGIKTLTVSGDLGGTGTINMSSLAHTLNLGGASNTIGTLTTTASGSIINYNRAGDQQVFASANYRNLTISSGGTKTIQNNVTVNNTLSLNNGNLSLGSGASNLTLAAGALISGSFDNTHMIVCDGTGSLIKQSTTAAGLVMTYPVGTGTYYTPMKINSLTASLAGTENVTVMAVSGVAPGASPTDLNKYWVVAKSAGLTGITANIDFTYDPAEVLGDQAAYQPYIYTGGAWSVPANPTANGVNPFGSTSTTVIAATWTCREKNTYYSYQSGNWNIATTWTTDPSGTLSISPGVPGSLDRVVILNGRTVSTTSTDPALNSYSLQINEGGTLDLQNTTGHNFGTVSGEGVLKLNTGAFPGGTFTSFVSSSGGTVEYYNLNSASISNAQRTYNHLIISNNTTNAYTCYIDNVVNPTDYLVNGNLTLKNNSTGNLTVYFGNPTASNNLINLTVYGNLTVNTGCNIRVNNFASAQTYPDPNAGGIPPDFPVHKIYLYGDLTNNGTIRFTGLPSAWDNAYYTQVNTTYGGTNYGEAQITFRGSTNNAVICNGTTDFFRLIVEKGIDQTYTLEVTSSNVNNFKLYGPNYEGRNVFDGGPEGYGYGVYSKALFIHYGTLKLNDNISIPSITEGGQDFNLIPSACLWINGATVSTTVIGLNGTGWQAATLYGKIRVSAGSFSTGDAAGIVLGSSSTPEIYVEGTATFSASQVWSAGTGNKISYIQTGGTTDIRGNGEVHAGYMLGLNNPNTVFVMTGGTLNFLNAVFTGTQGMDVRAATGNYTITGGTVNINLPGGITFDINATVPFYNLNITRASGGGNLTARFLNTSSSTISVLNDLTLNANTILDAGTNTVNLNVGHDFSMDAASTYTCGTNITAFNGSAGQRFTNLGSIQAGTGLYNLIISNTSNTDLYSSNLIVRNDLTINSGCFLNDNGKTISVAGNIVNSGTHTSQAGGAIILTGAGNPTTIGGNDSGVFGNLSINKSAGYTSITANQSVTGNLRLATFALLDISTYNFSLGSGTNVYDAMAGTTAVFSAGKMIRTSGNPSDGGITKPYNSTTAFIFPVGSNFSGTDYYTPATIQFTSAPSTWGSVTVKPVNHFNTFCTSNNSLNYYWKVIGSGFSGIAAGSVSHTYRYFAAALTGRGTETLYVPGRYAPYAWTIINDVSRVVEATKDILFTGVDYLDGDYTAGQPDALAAVKVFYSCQTGNWNDYTTWSTDSVGGPAVPSGSVPGVNIPGTNNPVVIGNGTTYNHYVTIPSTFNNVQVGGVQINTSSTLDITTSTGHNLGAIPDTKITGTGTLKISSSGATAQFPQGDFGFFLTTGGGTVEYYTTSGVNFALPNTRALNYNNLILTPGTGTFITLPDLNLPVYGNLSVNGVTTGYARTNITTTARTLTISGNINVNSGAFRIYNAATANPQSFIVNGDINVSSGAFFDNNTTSTVTTTHTLNIKGGLNNNGTFDMVQTPGGGNANQYVNVTFSGNTNKSISGTCTLTEFNYLTVDKGTDRNTILNVTINSITLSGTGTALILNNGTFRVDNTNLNLTLSTTTAFTVPSTACLSANQGTVNIGTTNDAGDLSLAGRLEVLNTGIVNIGTGGNYNNDIEYSPAGTPEIIVSGSTSQLNVNGQIRRKTDNTLGSLSYTQSGGSVTVRGMNQNATNQQRAKLEILNSGSQFNMSGGTIAIINGGGNSSYFGDLNIVPSGYSVSGGTITLGSASTNAAYLTFYVNASAPLYNLIVDGTTNNKIVNLRINPLVLNNNLTINGNSQFLANGFNVSIGGSLTNNNNNAGTGTSVGGYQAGSSMQVTTFDGTGAQGIAGSGTNLTNFAKLVIASTGTVTLLSNTALRVNGNLTLSSGTLNDGSNNITVTGNVDNWATHTSLTTSGGIIMAGAQVQVISGSGSGIFGNIVLNNPAGINLVDNSVINGELTFTNGTLYIDDYLLTFGTSASVGGSPDVTKMIMLNGVVSDQGVKKMFNSGSSSFTMPMGVTGKYTPVTYSVSANGAPGSITVRPVNTNHPAETSPIGDELAYYWSVTSTGFSSPTISHTYQYLSGDVSGTESNYVGGQYNYSTYVWTNLGDVVDEGNHQIILNNVNYITGEYTAGEPVNFGPVDILYSRDATSGGNWNNTNTWSITGHAGSSCGCTPNGNPVIIKVGHTVTLDADHASAYSVEINGTLDAGTTTFHNLGHVLGTGTLKLTSTPAGMFVVPGGDYDAFMSTTGTIVQFDGTNDASLPLKPGNYYKPYQNVIFSGSGIKYMSAENLKILGYLTINSGAILNNTLFNKGIVIYGNWTDNNTSALGGFVPGTGSVAFNGSVGQNVTIAGASTTEQYYNLIMNNPAGITLAGSGKVNISNNLTLTSGNVNTNATNLLSISNASTAAVIGGGSSSFVNGPLQKRISSGSFFNFPTGNASRYGNIYLSTVSATGDYIAQYYNHNPGTDGYDPNQKVNPIDVVSNVEYWRINGPAGTTSNVRVRWDDQSAIIPASASSRTKLRIVEWNGSAWQNRGNVINDGGQTSGTIQTSPVVSINGDHRFTIGVESLPTVAITSSNASFCNDGTSTTNITVALTGTAPWTIKYKVNGANETTINNIGSSPYNIVIGSSSPGISGNGDYTYNMSYISDATGATGIRDFTSTVIITAKDAPNPSISGLTSLPLNQNTNYQTGTGNISGHTYSWSISGNGTINSGGTTYQANVKFTSGVSGWVRVTETVTATGCVVTTSDYVITLTDVPNPNVTGPTSVCINTTQTYSTPNVPGHTYAWSLPLGGGNLVPPTDQASVQVNWTSSGSRSVMVTETGSSPVSNTLNVTVNPLPNITLSVSDPSICDGQTANVIVTSGEAGTDYTLRRNSDNFVIVTVHNGNVGNVTLPVTPTPAGTYVYNVLATSEYTCQAQLTDLSTVIVNSLPVVTITGPTEACEESTVTLDAGAGFSSYAWSFGATNLGNAQTQAITTQSLTAPINNVTETYTVVVTNAEGCSGSDTHDIIVYRLPDTGPNYYVPNEHNE